ncbi:MAG: hypothetical protein IKZ58_03405 [Selenomonadaceae bacterium]|nr:hypothetical protein [Selenomonadaceae bacterium]
MLSKILASTLIAGVILTGTVEAYDLPKIKADKKISADNKKPIFASDWESMTLFEDKLKILIAENKTLSPSSPERVSYDKNRVFIAFYKGNAYFLDKYSLQVKINSNGEKSWTQRIFPIGQNVSPKNSVATTQKFYFDGKNSYNALNKNNPIDAIVDAEDKAFLAECFKVGYYFAFGQELDE